jgi:hypothetical protein
MCTAEQQANQGVLNTLGGIVLIAASAVSAYWHVTDMMDDAQQEKSIADVRAYADEAYAKVDAYEMVMRQYDEALDDVRREARLAQTALEGKDCKLEPSDLGPSFFTAHFPDGDGELVPSGLFHFEKGKWYDKAREREVDEVTDAKLHRAFMRMLMEQKAHEAYVSEQKTPIKEIDGASAISIN